MIDLLKIKTERNLHFVQSLLERLEQELFFTEEEIISIIKKNNMMEVLNDGKYIKYYQTATFFIEENNFLGNKAHHSRGGFTDLNCFKVKLGDYGRSGYPATIRLKTDDGSRWAHFPGFLNAITEQSCLRII